MPTRKWGTEKLVDAVSTGLQKLPKVAVLADGGFVVVWEDDSGAFAAIRGQRFDAAGNRVGAPLAIDVAAGNNEVLPSVTALANGGFYVTWTQLVGADNYILGNVYDAAGALVRSQNVVFAFGQDSNAQVVRFGAGSAVAWEDPDANQGDINVRLFDAAGNGGAVLIPNIVTDGL